MPKRLPSIVLALVAAGAVAFPAVGQGIRCTRDELQRIANAYVTAQTAGDPTKLPLAGWTEYLEQADAGSMSTGIISTPLKLDLVRHLLDTRACATFSEVVVADPAKPYVLGTRLQFTGADSPIAPSSVNTIETIVTDKNDWLFNAGRTLQFAKAENWGVIPEGERDSRETILAAATAYLDSFTNKGAAVSFGTPCALLEGGYYTGKAAGGDDRCDRNLPTGVKTTERKAIVDETIGAVAVMLRLGDKQSPDVHLFRVEKGKIRYVHTMTVCTTANCGVAVPEEARKQLGM